MARIEVLLFPSKAARVTATVERYSVVEGESGETEINVSYPAAYIAHNRYVYMRNAKGECASIIFDKREGAHTFTLPASMTFAGTTTLVFYAESDTEKAVWLPIEIPIAATSVDYKEVARASPDILREAIKATEEIREFLKQQKG